VLYSHKNILGFTLIFFILQQDRFDGENFGMAIAFWDVGNEGIAFWNVGNGRSL
jgi:hypothetical protein